MHAVSQADGDPYDASSLVAEEETLLYERFKVTHDRRGLYDVSPFYFGQVIGHLRKLRQWRGEELLVLGHKKTARRQKREEQNNADNKGVREANKRKEPPLAEGNRHGWESSVAGKRESHNPRAGRALQTGLVFVAAVVRGKGR